MTRYRLNPSLGLCLAILPYMCFALFSLPKTNKKNVKRTASSKVNRLRLKGQGDYKATLSKMHSLLQTYVPKGSWSALGSAVGGRFGAPSAGAAVGDVIAKITGFGDYTVHSNSLGKQFAAGQPMANFATSFKNGGGMHVSHREFLGDVPGSVGFSIKTKISINPALFGFAPWLSAIAANFESYRLKGCVFEYRPTSGMIGGSTAALGSIIMATDYNIKNPPFDSKQTMESYEFSTQTVPYQGAYHGIECARDTSAIQTPFLRTYANANQDTQFCDIGNFYLATQGMQNTGIVGELWVIYDVELLKPRINFFGTSDFWSFKIDQPAIGTGNPLGVSIFDANTMASPAWSPSLSYPVTPFNTNDDILWMHKPGDYVVSVTWDNSDSTITTQPDFTWNTDEIEFLNETRFGEVKHYNNTSASIIVVVKVKKSDSAMALTGLAGLSGASVSVLISPISDAF